MTNEPTAAELLARLNALPPITETQIADMLDKQRRRTQAQKIAAESYPDPADRRRYAAKLAFMLHDEPDAWNDIGQHFTNWECDLLRSLRARYGALLTVSRYQGSEHVYINVRLYHEDTIAHSDWDHMIAELDPTTGQDAMIIHGWRSFQLTGLGCYGRPLVLSLLYTRYAAIEELVVKHLPDVAQWNGAYAIPVFPAVRGGDFNKCPTFGEARHYPDPAMLLGDGIVIGLGSNRYRVWFDYANIMDDDGYMHADARLNGERRLQLELTDAPETAFTTERAIGPAYLTMRGYGVSQQTDTATRFNGKLPMCLLHFQNGGDCTWNLMVTLDDNGDIRVAWLEVSST